MTEHLEKSGQFLSYDEHCLRVDDQYNHSYLVKSNNIIIGMLKYKPTCKHVEIIQIQIAPDFQKQGYGSHIIKHIIHSSAPKKVLISVLKDNPAYKLYLDSGFHMVSEDNYEYHLQTCG